MSTNIFVSEGGPIYDDKSDGDQLPGWYFWDETDAHYHGPFATRKIAEESLTNYAKQL